MLKNIINNINCEIKENSICSILGPNGRGKSTLLKAIFNAIVFSGDVFIKEQNNIINTKKISAKELAKLIAYVPQRYNIAFEFSVIDVILMGLYARSGFLDTLKYHDLVVSNLERVNILYLKDERFSNLSGGQNSLF